MSNSWPLVRLGEVLHLAIDAVPVDPSVSYPIAGVYSFGRGLLSRAALLGSETTYKVLHRLHVDDFVLSQLKGWEGALAKVPRSYDGWFLSPQFPTFRAITAQLDISYLDWYCKQSKVWEELRNTARGMGARRDSVSPDRFLALKIPLPPLSEQRQIVSRIDELAAKTEEAKGLRRQTVKEAEAVVKTVAREVLSEVNVSNTNLGSWLDGEREGIQTGPFGAQLGSTDFTESGTPVLTIGNIQYDGLHLDSLKRVSQEKAAQLERYRVKMGDVLFARMGTVGRCCIVPSEAEGWLINYHIIRVALDKQRVEPRYIHWTIQTSAEVEEYLDDKIRRATRQGVNSTIVGMLPCRVPLISEQRRIVAYLDDLQAKVDDLKCVQAETSAELDAMLPSVLDRAFKGDLL